MLFKRDNLWLPFTFFHSSTTIDSSHKNLKKKKTLIDSWNLNPHISSTIAWTLFNFVFWLQAQCWPNCMKSLGSWYPDSVRNTVFGMFGTCAFAGGIIGTGLAVWLQTSYGWRSAFFTPSIIVVRTIIIIFTSWPQSYSDSWWLQYVKLKYPDLSHIVIADGYNMLN